jgi:hypothetical protein
METVKTVSELQVEHATTALKRGVNETRTNYTPHPNPYTLILAAALLFGLAATTVSQTKRPAANFRGEWDWVVYAKSRSELPRGYRDADLKDVPQAHLYLKLEQRGNKLSGEYDASRRYLAKLEEGEFDAVIENNTAKFELQSGFNGKVTVLLKLRGGFLHWKIITSEGEFYFPDDVILRRLITKKKKHHERARI